MTSLAGLLLDEAAQELAARAVDRAGADLAETRQLLERGKVAKATARAERF